MAARRVNVAVSEPPAVDHDRLLGPVGLLPHDVDELQDAFDGVDRGDAVVGPGRVVQVEDVPTLIRLQGGSGMGSGVISGPRTLFLTHVSQPEFPDGPFGRLRLRQHLHADLAVHDEVIGEGPVVVTFDLR